MQDGKHIIYAVQTRITHRSPWLRPKGKLSPADDEDDEEWFFASFDYFGRSWEPHHGAGNDWRPISPKSHDELHDVQHLTGQSGYFRMDYALRALKRLRKADDAGKFDSQGPYGKKSQAVRHEFRLVKITMNQKTEAVDQAEIVEAL